MADLHPGGKKAAGTGMARQVVGKTQDIAAGTHRAMTVRGRPIVVFNVAGEFFALLDRCPHQGAELARGMTRGIAVSDEPGRATCLRPGGFIRCPWHGWEFDIRTGQSWCDPDRVAVRRFPVTVEPGSALVAGPYRAETLPVSVEDDYIVVDV